MWHRASARHRLQEWAAPFAPNSNTPSEPKAEVQYRLPSTGDVGFLEYIVAPNSDKRAILMVLGTTSVGVQAAVDALLNPELRTNMAGNLSVINGDKVDSSEVAVQPDTIGSADPSGVGELTATRVAAPAINTNIPAWLVPMARSSPLILGPLRIARSYFVPFERKIALPSGVQLRAMLRSLSPKMKKSRGPTHRSICPER